MVMVDSRTERAIARYFVNGGLISGILDVHSHNVVSRARGEMMSMWEWKSGVEGLLLKDTVGDKDVNVRNKEDVENNERRSRKMEQVGGGQLLVPWVLLLWCKFRPIEGTEYLC